MLLSIKIWKKLSTLLAGHNGQGLMEYALIMSLISLAVILTLPPLRDWLVLSINQIIFAFS